ncbi:MAG: sterol desaturase family protein [Saprospiraceae bacterium]
MEAYANSLKIAILFFVVLIIIEYGFSILLKKRVYEPMDTISGLSSGLTNNIKSIFKLTVVVVSYTWMIENWSLFQLSETALTYFLAFILIDFASYWSHRWNHEFNLLWNRHIIHHSSEEFNLSAALRQPISGVFAIYFFLYIPMALIGIPSKVIAIIAPLHLFAQFWYHTRLINKMGFLEHIIVTPSHHRVHHAINPEYLDKNYAAIFIFWDKWFGTFQEELADKPPVYGVTKAVETWNPVIINVLHLWQLIKDAWRTKSWKDKFRIWLMPTGWRPADVNEKYPIIYNKNPYEQVKYKTATTTFLTIWSFFQLTIHLVFQFHILVLLPDLPFQETLLYGLFTVVSVFAYTTLMDRHWFSIPAEFIKMICGFTLFFSFNNWFGIDEMLPFTSTFVVIYFIISFGITVYYGSQDYRKKQTVSIFKTDTV